MRGTAGRAWRTSRRVRVPAALARLAAAAACGALVLVPADVGASAATTALAGQAFGGTAAVGALFTVNAAGTLGAHFCTATVVHSPHGDLAVTAAHCVTGFNGQVAYVPGYDNGKKPHGVWRVSAVYTDQAWRSRQDPDDDVAFLRLAAARGGGSVEHVTGAERLAAGWPQPALVQVIGYPADAGQPIRCTNRSQKFSPTQLEFDCGGYTDGTSGGPFLAASGHHTVIGVIGGYEQGGDTPDVSYAAAFGPAVTALYRSAEAVG